MYVLVSPKSIFDAVAGLVFAWEPQQYPLRDPSDPAQFNPLCRLSSDDTGANSTASRPLVVRRRALCLVSAHVLRLTSETFAAMTAAAGEMPFSSTMMCCRRPSFPPVYRAGSGHSVAKGS